MRKLTVFLLIIGVFVAFASNAQTKIKGQSATTSLNIKKKKLPPLLTVTDVKFVDNNGNDRIDAFEDCNITFKITNTGKGPAMNMKMIVTNQSDVKGLNFIETTTITTINAGSSQVITFPVSGTLNLTTGKSVIKITFDEPLGFPPDEIVLNIPTKEFSAPEVKVADYQFITDNGVVKLGFPIQLKAYIQNTGQGIAENVVV